MRPRISSLTFIFICALSLFQSSGYANDASFGGLGADLTPQVQSNVIMRAEVIRATEKQAGFTWEIEARYTFHNPTDKVVTVNMGFPERFCHPDSDCASPSGDHTTFRGITTEVRGVKVKTTIQSVSRQSEWSGELGRVHLFKVDFKPQETVEIIHRYEMGISTSVERELNFDYVTKTGALWGAPIGEATFIIRVKRRPYGFVFPKGYQLTEFEHVSGMTQVAFQQKNWIPTNDLMVTFNYHASMFGCPPMRELLAEHTGPVTQDTVLPLVAMTDVLDLEGLRVCRNIPYARHGYRFKKKSLADRLYQYRAPTSLPLLQRSYGSYAVPQEEEAGGYLGVLFRESPHYDPKMLTAEELTWVRIFKELEQLRKAQPK